MAKHNVPVQSLIDHIKTAVDVDPWAKEMVEELLKEREDEKKRILKVIYDTLHEGLSIDCAVDQDYVYKLIRSRIENGGEAR